MVHHNYVLYNMYVQVYILLWCIIIVYYILCVSKYICYYAGVAASRQRRRCIVPQAVNTV